MPSEEFNQYWNFDKVSFIIYVERLTEKIDGCKNNT